MSSTPWNLLGILIFSVGLGLLFDAVFDTNPWGLIGFVIFGFIGSFFQLFSRLRQGQNRSQKDEHD